MYRTTNFATSYTKLDFVYLLNEIDKTFELYYMPTFCSLNFKIVHFYVLDAEIGELYGVPIDHRNICKPRSRYSTNWIRLFAIKNVNCWERKKNTAVHERSLFVFNNNNSILNNYEYLKVLPLSYACGSIQVNDELSHRSVNIIFDFVRNYQPTLHIIELGTVCITGD